MKFILNLFPSYRALVIERDRLLMQGISQHFADLEISRAKSDAHHARHVAGLRIWNLNEDIAELKATVRSLADGDITAEDALRYLAEIERGNDHTPADELYITDGTGRLWLADDIEKGSIH